MGAKLTLKDITTATWGTLSNPPDGTAPPTQASAICLRDVAVCKKDTANRIDDKPYYARNKNWNPGLLPNITKPISWPFLQQPIFKKSSFATWDVLNLAFVASPPAGYTVKIYSVTYAAGASLPPQFIAVAFPMDLDISTPPPFLVHYKHIPGQGYKDKNGIWHESPFFKYFDPFGYDWLAYEIWNWWAYKARQLPDGSFLTDMPFLSNQQFSFGFPYQLRRANKQYVVVLPQISRIFDQGTGKLRDYQLYSASMLREILVAIQQDILSIKDDKLSHVAISANSSGCNVLSSFLTGNLAAMKGDKAVATFMNDEFNEIFVLDPPEDFGDAMVTSMDGWRKLSSTRSGSKGKCIRFYTHSFTKNFALLTDTGKNPFTRGKNGFWESSLKTISLAYMPFSTDGDDVWQNTYYEILPSGNLSVNNFGFVHHVIPALCLTDATVRSLYV